jgi:hypothetical protein
MELNTRRRFEYRFQFAPKGCDGPLIRRVVDIGQIMPEVDLAQHFLYTQHMAKTAPENESVVASRQRSSAPVEIPI